MNERIRELAKQTNIIGDWGEDITEGRYFVCDNLKNLEKFAELIVRECVDKIISKGTDWVDFAPSQTGVRPEYWDMAQQIKQHFGVEL